MKLAAAALVSAVLFLFVALGGHGNAPVASQGVPEAILLAGVPAPAAASAGGAAAPAPSSTSGAAGPLLAVGRSVLAMQLSQSGASPQPGPDAPLATSTNKSTPAARRQTVAPGPPQVITASNGSGIETIPAPTTLISPAPPVVSTSIGPATPVPPATPPPAPTSTVTPGPSPSPTAAPFSARQRLLRSILGL